MATIAGFGLGLVVFVFALFVLLMYLLIKFIGCALAPFMGNILAGGLLYVLIDAFDLVKLDWSFFDAIVVAVFGIPGTIFLAVWEAIN